MPHQCVRCNKFYDDGAAEILKGCDCGGKLFFYIRKEKLEEVKNMTSDITEDEAKEIEQDVFDLVRHQIMKNLEPRIGYSFRDAGFHSSCYTTP